MIEREELEWALKKLEHTGQLLKITSITLLALSLLHISLVFSALSRLLYINSSGVTMLSIILTFAVSFLALWFDALRKDGKSYYDEISGALHGVSTVTGELEELKIDSLMARIAVRKFMNSYDIPLIPGRFGPGILVLLNFMVLTISVAPPFPEAL